MFTYFLPLSSFCLSSLLFNYVYPFMHSCYFFLYCILIFSCKSFSCLLIFLFLTFQFFSFLSYFAFLCYFFLFFFSRLSLLRSPETTPFPPYTTLHYPQPPSTHRNFSPLSPKKKKNSHTHTHALTHTTPPPHPTFTPLHSHPFLGTLTLPPAH